MKYGFYYGKSSGVFWNVKSITQRMGVYTLKTDQVRNTTAVIRAYNIRYGTVDMIEKFITSKI